MQSNLKAIKANTFTPLQENLGFTKFQSRLINARNNQKINNLGRSNILAPGGDINLPYNASYSEYKNQTDPQIKKLLEKRGHQFKFGGKKEEGIQINKYGILIGDPKERETKEQYIKRAIEEERQKAVDRITYNYTKLKNNSVNNPEKANGFLDNLLGKTNVSEIKSGNQFLGYGKTWGDANAGNHIQSYKFFGNYDMGNDFPTNQELTANALLKAYNMRGGRNAEKKIFENPLKYGFSEINGVNIPKGSFYYNYGNEQDAGVYMDKANFINNNNPYRIFKFQNNYGNINDSNYDFNTGYDFNVFYYPTVYKNTGYPVDTEALPVFKNYAFVGTPNQIKKWTNQYNKYFEDKAASEETAQQVAEPVIEQAPVVAPIQETQQVFQAPPSWYISAYNGMKKKFPNMSDEGIHRTIMSARNMIGNDQYRQWRNQQWKNGGPLKKFESGGPIDYSDDYDYEGFYNDPTMKIASNGHYPDKYKKPIHITFSEESKYSKNNNPNSPYQGGKWVYPPAWMNYNTKPMFVPSYTNKQFYNPQDYYNYSERTGENLLLPENLTW